MHETSSPTSSAIGKKLTMATPVSNMLNKFHGQPTSYDKKFATRSLTFVDALTKEIDPCTDLAEHLELEPMESLERQKGPIRRKLRSRSS